MTDLPTTARQLHYGGDYNPEQWPPAVWDEDYSAFDEAGINTVTLGVFAWSHLETADGVYDFELMDAIVERAVGEGRHIVMATATAAVPPWLAHEHPEVMRTTFEGRRRAYGQRHLMCPNSTVYRAKSAALAGRIAERYHDVDAIVAWHIGNEYGGFDGGCFCDDCAAAFRDWLRDRYGSIDRLNDAWNTMFWSHRYSDWDQIVVPNALSEHWKGPRHTAFQGTSVDYLRFMTDSMVECYRLEKEAIRRHDHRPTTTNFMGLFRSLDYHRWADVLDFASWDNYPPGPREEARMALAHDLMRGVKGGNPFWLMEQTPTITASRDVNPVKRPGVMGLWSWQAVAHGADAVLFFQLRQSKGASEKYHGAVLDHAGRTDTRAFREIARLGAELAGSEALLGARTPARVALLFDWDSWWLTEMTDGLNRHVSYVDVLLRHYRSAWELGAAMDVVPVTSDLGSYDVVLAPLLHMVKGDVADRLDAVVGRGGSVVTGFWSGLADVDTNAILEPGPGPLRQFLGIEVEEIDSHVPGHVVPLVGTVGAGSAELVCEVLRCHDAEVVATYGAEFYIGTPAVTRRRHPSGGSGWYLGALLDQTATTAIMRQVLDDHGLVGPYADERDLEHAVRDAKAGRVHFLLNHAPEERTIALHAAGTEMRTGERLEAGESVSLEAHGVLVWKQDPPEGDALGH